MDQNKTTTITLIHQNIAGVLNKQELIEVALTDLQLEVGSIDIVCLTETFLKTGCESNLRINNYKMASFFSRSNQRRGGSCILVKNNIQYKQIVNLIPPIPLQFEYCAIEIIKHNLIVICIYRTPTHDALMFLNSLELLTNKLCKKGKKKVIMCGDWNIDILKINKTSNDLNAILNNNNLKNFITLPTRKTSCLDLIVSNIRDARSALHYLALSDHETAQSLTVNLETDNKVKDIHSFWFKTVRELSDENIIKFRDCLASLSFSEVYECHSTNNAFNCLHDTLILFYNLCFPIIKIKINNKQVKNRGLTKGIKRCCIKKRTLYLKYNLCKDNKKQNKKKYEDYTRILKRCIHKAQQINGLQYINKAKNASKAAWNLIKADINNTTSNTDIDTIQINNNNNNNDIDNDDYENGNDNDNDNKIYDNPNHICDLFNNYYISLTNSIQKPKEKKSEYQFYNSSKP